MATVVGDSSKSSISKSSSNYFSAVHQHRPGLEKVGSGVDFWQCGTVPFAIRHSKTLAGKRLEAGAAEPSTVMNITTSPKIWAHPNLLTEVHKANEIIEREAGPKSETLAVYWGLSGAEGKGGFVLRLTVVDAGSPQTPFTFSDGTNLEGLREEFRKWCGGRGPHE